MGIKDVRESEESYVQNSACVIDLFIRGLLCNATDIHYKLFIGGEKL